VIRLSSKNCNGKRTSKEKRDEEEAGQHLMMQSASLFFENEFPNVNASHKNKW
jgi:hypothetical protein